MEQEATVVYVVDGRETSKVVDWDDPELLLTQVEEKTGGVMGLGSARASAPPAGDYYADGYVRPTEGVPPPSGSRHQPFVSDDPAGAPEGESLEDLRRQIAELQARCGEPVLVGLSRQNSSAVAKAEAARVARENEALRLELAQEARERQELARELDEQQRLCASLQVRHRESGPQHIKQRLDNDEWGGIGSATEPLGIGQWWQTGEDRREEVNKLRTVARGVLSQTYGSILTVISHINDVPCCWNQQFGQRCQKCPRRP